MGHAKTKVAVSCLLKADCTKELSPEIYVSVKEVHIKLSPCTLQGWSTHTRTCTRTYSSTFFQYLAVLCTWQNS